MMTRHQIHKETPVKPNSMPSLIESITGVWKFHRWPGQITYAHSLPGHLFHYLISGQYHLTSNGREYDVKPGDIIYYHEVEDVTIEYKGRPIEFYSIGFIASHWPALPLSMRVFRGNKDAKKLFANIYKSFAQLENTINQAKLFANLYQLIELIERERNKIKPNSQITHSLWWEIENQLVRNREFHASIDDMQNIALVSRSTLNRVCKTATGLPPQQRLMQLRMNHAQGLLLHSFLSISQIAKQLGYTRINEFSREYSRTFGTAPSKTRHRVKGNKD